MIRIANHLAKEHQVIGSIKRPIDALFPTVVQLTGLPTSACNPNMSRPGDPLRCNHLVELRRKGTLINLASENTWERHELLKRA
jgi:hypothetical protein